MTGIERQTRSRIMQLFSERGYRPRHDLGQNFLVDINLVEYVVNQAQLDRRDVVLEIGAGTGGLTSFLAEQAGTVIAVEIDEHMHGLAIQMTAGCDNVTLLNCDALKNKNHLAPQVLEAVEASLAVASDHRLKLVANLPYTIATPVISNLVRTDLPWELMVVTIQWELAARMTASPGKGSYGALSAWLQAQCDITILKRLGASVFWPRPKVESAIVRLAANRERQAAIANREYFHDFLQRLFNQRRKLMRSTLVGMYRKDLQKSEIDAVLINLQISEQSRAEELSSLQLTTLANDIFRRMERQGVRRDYAKAD